MTRVLVVDDEEDIREALGNVLVDAGHEVVPAANGEDALAYLLGAAATLPDVILLDLRMPVMDGITFLASLRRLPETRKRDIPVVVMTAGDEGLAVGHHHEPVRGANASIPKPFGISALLEVVESWSTPSR